jgi:hypothetical protein
MPAVEDKIRSRWSQTMGFRQESVYLRSAS